MKHPALSAPSTCRLRLASAVPSAWTQANSFKNMTLLTRMDEVTYEVPQVPQMRSGDLYPSAMERTSRSEQAMN